jgi:hypothetical protein
MLPDWKKVFRFSPASNALLNLIGGGGGDVIWQIPYSVKKWSEERGRKEKLWLPDWGAEFVQNWRRRRKLPLKLAGCMVPSLNKNLSRPETTSQIPHQLDYNLCVGGGGGTEAGSSCRYFSQPNSKKGKAKSEWRER